MAELIFVTVPGTPRVPLPDPVEDRGRCPLLLLPGREGGFPVALLRSVASKARMVAARDHKLLRTLRPV